MHIWVSRERTYGIRNRHGFWYLVFWIVHLFASEICGTSLIEISIWISKKQCINLVLVMRENFPCADRNYLCESLSHLKIRKPRSIWAFSLSDRIGYFLRTRIPPTLTIWFYIFWSPFPLDRCMNCSPLKELLLSHCHVRGCNGSILSKVNYALMIAKVIQLISISVMRYFYHLRINIELIESRQSYITCLIHLRDKMCP